LVARACKICLARVQRCALREGKQDADQRTGFFAVSWTTVIWSMLAAASLTLAAIHLPVWIRNRTAWPGLFFTLMCVGTAGMVLCEAWMMHMWTPQEYARVLRWRHVPIWLVITSLVGFVYVYLGAGRLWLAWSIVVLRTIALLANFTTGVNVNFLEIVEMRSIQFLGEAVSLPVGVPNPWMAVAQLSTWLCVVFVADATATAWRRGARGKALRFGGTSVLLLIGGATQGVLIVWADVQMPPVSSLFFIGVLATMAYELSRDLLRAEHLAAQLGESERRMVLAAEAANVGIWSRDLARNEIWANNQWRALLGFTPTEPLSPGRLIEKVHPDDRDRMRRILAESAESPGVYHAEFRVLMPDGEVRWIDAQRQIDFNAQGRAIRTRGSSIDCTARKKSEQETLLLRQEIAHVGRVSVLGQLASGLAHEINQPLGAILRNAEAAALFLREEFPDLDEIRAILEDIRKDDQRAGAVIDRMRSLLRRQDVEMRPLGVEELFNDIAALLRPEAAARHVKLDLDVGRDMPQVAGDRIHLQQVLLNLVSNGMDSIDQSGRSGRSIVLSARRDGGQSVEITVSDSGRGIAATDIGRLFEPFFTTKPKGMGMGLSISRTIIEAHGGKMWAENHDGGGARFVFTVPTA
jgi:two-component system, LuxR family, sensor kinase FixL